MVFTPHICGFYPTYWELITIARTPDIIMFIHFFIKNSMLFFLYLYKGVGFSPYNGQVVFFEKNSQKISTFLPLHSKIRLVFSFRQAEQTKNGIKLLDLDQQLYQPNHQVLSFQVINLSDNKLRSWGLAPKPPASTHTQKQGNSTLDY